MSKTKEILKRSGVSRSTLFRFLRGDNVRPQAKKAILEAMDELGYQPENRYILGDIVFEISVMKDFEKFRGFTEVIQGITKRAEEKGIKIQLAIRSKKQIERDYENWNENGAVKGIIIVGKDLENEELERDILGKKGIPHIFVNRVIDKPDTSYVSVDVRAGAFDIVDYLIKKGHKLIAALGYPDKLRIDRDKLNGYYDAFRKNDLEIPKKYESKKYSSMTFINFNESAIKVKEFNGFMWEYVFMDTKNDIKGFEAFLENGNEMYRFSMFVSNTDYKPQYKRIFKRMFQSLRIKGSSALPELSFVRFTNSLETCIPDKK
jgi:DNA-binding LacI/PurR family transcriptional regulator